MASHAGFVPYFIADYDFFDLLSLQWILRCKWHNLNMQKGLSFSCKLALAMSIELLFTCCLWGHVRNTQWNHYSQSLHLHDGGFSKRQSSSVSQRWHPLSANSFVNFCLDLVLGQNSSRKKHCVFNWLNQMCCGECTFWWAQQYGGDTKTEVVLNAELIQTWFCLKSFSTSLIFVFNHTAPNIYCFF